MKPRLLLDMDGVMVDLHKNWENRLKELHPNKSIDFSKITESITDECHKAFGISEDECIVPFYEKDFWLNLPPQDDVLEYFPLIREKFDCVIVTKAHMTSPYCAYEKFLWIRKYFGNDLDIIMTKKKSYIHGDIIIDDMVTNLVECDKVGIIPICYDHPWNKDHPFKNRVNSWKEIYKKLNLMEELK